MNISLYDVSVWVIPLLIAIYYAGELVWREGVTVKLGDFSPWNGHRPL